jgi:hypothetical protein
VPDFGDQKAIPSQALIQSGFMNQITTALQNIRRESSALNAQQIGKLCRRVERR